MRPRGPHLSGALGAGAGVDAGEDLLLLGAAAPLQLVVDEHGGTEGIITRADLVEEVLADALPGAERDLYIEALGQGMLVASGNARLEDIAQTLETEIPADGIDTIGGLAFMLSGQLPKPGTTLHSDTIRITIRRTSRKRIEEVLVERTNGILQPGGGL